MHAAALFALLATAPLASATCNFQSVGTLSKAWRLSTCSSQNCLNIVQDVTHSGFGTWCINIPNTTRSFIYSVGTGYNPANLEDYTIFFKTTDSCDGDTFGRSRGEWKKATLSADGERMANAYVQCTKLFQKREGRTARESASLSGPMMGSGMRRLPTASWSGPPRVLRSWRPSRLEDN